MSESPGIRAVVFDLFGTLVAWPAAHRNPLPDVLGLAAEAFFPAWRQSRVERDRGELDCLAVLRRICASAGVPVSEERLRAALDAYREDYRRILVPRERALLTLGVLRRAGLRLGLLSDTGEHVVELWPGTALARYFDAAVFSCQERAIKPDPRLYALICDRLAVPPGDSMYVANGDRDELRGARVAGMRAVLLRVAGETRGAEAESWSGEWISRLDDVVSLVGVGPNRHASA